MSWCCKLSKEDDAGSGNKSVEEKQAFHNDNHKKTPASYYQTPLTQMFSVATLSLYAVNHHELADLTVTSYIVEASLQTSHSLSAQTNIAPLCGEGRLIVEMTNEFLKGKYTL